MLHASHIVSAVGNGRNIRSLGRRSVSIPTGVPTKEAVSRSIAAIESEIERSKEPSWKPPLTVKEGTLRNRILRFLKQEPPAEFVLRPDEEKIKSEYMSQFFGMTAFDFRKVFGDNADIARMKKTIDPALGAEYCRVRRFANKEENIPYQDWRPQVAAGSSIIYNKNNSNYSSPLWLLRLEALVDFGVVTGFEKVVKEFDRLRKYFEKQKPTQFNPRYYMIRTTNLPTQESFQMAQSLGFSPPVIVEAYTRIVSAASGSTRDRLVGGFSGGSLNEIGINLCRLLEHFGLHMVPTPKEKLTLKEVRENYKSLNRTIRELPLIEQVQIGVALFRVLRKHLKICGEPLFIEVENHVGCVMESPFFSKSRFDLQEFTLVTLNPKLTGLLDELERGDPPKVYWSLTNRNVESFWMPTPEGPRLFVKNNPFPVDLQEVFMRADANIQVQSVVNANFPGVLKGLNALGQVRWQPNWDVIQMYEDRMASGVGFGDMVPESLSESYEALVVSNLRLRSLAKSTYRSIDKKIDTLNADREKIINLVPASEAEKWKALCDGYLTQKIGKMVSDQASLNFARKFNAERTVEAAQNLGDSFYIPYNLDFRGRCYPIPKSLNPIGDDFSRGTLRFHRKVPLGPRGFFWLKVHLANQFGQDKLPFDKRAEWTMKNIDHIMNSVPVRDRPMEYYYSTNQFWSNTKSPVQAYAACVELASAMRHEHGPLEFPSSLPVHQDGSCNGLQHYAAIARDEVGGRSVNLTPSAQPSDVYAEVVSEVKETIDRDAAEYQELNINDAFVGTLFAEWERTKRTFEVKGEPVFDPLTGVMLQGRPDIDPNFLRDLEQMRKGKLGEAMERRSKSRDKRRAARQKEISDTITKETIVETAKEKATSQERAQLRESQLEAMVDLYFERREYKSVRQLMLFLTELYVANAVQPVVNRNLVKQTVMTSVYGVTHLGAQRQIFNRLTDARNAGQLPLVNKEHMFFISRYLTALTIEATENLFESAFGIMAWLKRAGQTVTRFGQPLSWTTPLGLPVTQTYSYESNENADDYGKLRRSKWTVGLSLGHEIGVLKSLQGRPELQLIHSQKQASAFPPNFVHSLDSTHMLNTAVRCVGTGCDFAAVHDSFWCHAAHVDYMSGVLRQEFIKLHEQDLLRDLILEWKSRYPFMKTFEDIPERGTLDIRSVRDSPYFFS